MDYKSITTTIQDILWQSIKTQWRGFQDTFYSSIATLLFFIFEFLFIYLFVLIHSISNAVKNSRSESPTDGAPFVDTTSELDFLLSTIKVSLLLFICGLLIFVLFRLFIDLNQITIIQIEEFKTKLFLGATPTRIAAETVTEYFIKIPVLLLVGGLLAKVGFSNLVSLLTETFPFEPSKINSLFLPSFGLTILSLTGLILSFLASWLFIQRKIEKSIL